jgi:hypothetical protein
MLLIDHRGKKPKFLQVSSQGAIEFKEDLTERQIMGRFGNFDQPEDPVAIVREGFSTGGDQGSPKSPTKA